MDIDLYKDFKGYNSYESLKDAEKVIRTRIAEYFNGAMDEILKCETKAKDMGRLKELSDIGKIIKRMKRLGKLMEARDELFVCPYLKDGLTHLDENKMKNIDTRVVDIIATIKDLIKDLTCSEVEMHLIQKFAAINENLHTMEDICHERSLVLKDIHHEKKE